MSDEKDWGAVIDAMGDEEGLPAAENAPQAAPTPTPVAAPQLAPTPEGGRQLTVEQPDWGAVIDALPEANYPGYKKAIEGGFTRSLNRIESSVPTIQGVGAELTGDTEAAARYAEEAKAIEAQAPKPIVDSVRDIESFQDFTYWAAERLPEQAPNLALMAAGGGVGGVLAKLVGRGIVSAEVAATVGAGVPNWWLETAGTAEELRGATGSFQPKTSIGVGFGKAILETYGPVKFMKEMHNASIFSAGLSAAVREGLLTEPWQEMADILARKYHDPNYKFFGENMTLNPVTWFSEDVKTRLAESAATGFATGHAYATGAQAVVKGLEKVLPEKVEPPMPVKDFSQFPEPPPAIPGEIVTHPEPPPDEPLKPAALSWLREMQLKDQLQTPYDPKPSAEPVTDAIETGPIEHGIKLDWQTELANAISTERVLNIEDDNLPRYAVVDEDGNLGTRILTDTDLEEETARAGPLYKPQKLMQVDMGSLQPAAITAEVWDLPNVEDNRIWFLPGTTVPEQQALLQQYEQAQLQIEELKPERFTQGLAAQEQARAVYEPLLDSGLRVIPSRGASFEYNGLVEGKEVTERPKTRRGIQAYTGPQDLRAGAKLFLPEPMERFPDAEDVRPAQQALALDFNKIPDDAFTVDADGVLTLTKDIDPSAVTYGYGMLAGRPTVDFFAREHVHHSLHNKDPKAALEVTKVAAQVTAWWNDYEPYLKSVAKKLGIKMPALVVSESAAVSPSPDAVMAYESVMNAIIYNPYVEYQNFISPGPRTQVGFLLSMLHEFGHAVTMQTWDKLPPRIQGLVLEGYKRALLTTRITGSTAHVQIPGIPLDADVGHRYYYMSFQEYLAEQSRRWNSADATAMSPQEKFFKSVGRKLTGMYNGFVEKIGEDKALQLFIPDYSFNTWYDYLQDGQKEDNPATGAPGVGLRKMIQNKRRMNMDFRVPPDLRPTYVMVMDALNKFGHLIPRGTKIRAIDYEPGTRAELSSESPDITYGSYEQQQDVITIVIGALAYSENPKAAEKLVVHEAFHSIQKYLEPGEREILVRGAKLAKSLPHRLLGDYWREHRQNFRDVGIDPDSPITIAIVKEELEFEAVARLLDSRLEGKDFGAETNTLLDKIIEFFQRVINMAKGNGFQSLRDVEKAFFKGEFARRKDQDALMEEVADSDFYNEGMFALQALQARATPAEDIKYGQPHPGPILAYHGSYNDIELFDPGRTKSFGTHFGTQEQGSTILGDVEDAEKAHDEYKRQYPEYYKDRNAPPPRVYPVILDIKNPLEIKDGDHEIDDSSLGTFQDLGIEFTLDEQKAYFNRERDEVYFDDETPDEFQDDRSETGKNLQRAIIGHAVRRAGYDSMRYWNTIEGPVYGGYSYILWEGSENKVHSTHTGIRMLSKDKKGTKRPPSRVEEIEPGLTVHVFDREDEMMARDMTSKVVKAKNYAFTTTEGTPIGYVLVHLEAGIGWDVDMIDVMQKFKGKFYPEKMFKYVAKDVGEQLQASGVLTPAGYNALKRRAPEQVIYHVHDPVSNNWFSPRQIQLQIDGAKYLDNKMSVKKWEWMLNKVPKAFFTDAAAAKRFSRDVAGRKGMERDAQRGQQEAEKELMSAIGGDRMPVDPFLRSYGQKKGTTQPENNGMANLFNWLRKQPTGSPNAGIVINAADDISNFSKKWWSIQQLQWRNTHIPSLQDYKTNMEKYNTLRMRWTSRADQTLRKYWDINDLTNAQKDAVGDLLFWATEMNYLSPQERAQKVVRHPSNMELVQQMQRLGFNQATKAAYDKVKLDFDEFLTDIETVTIAHHARDFANQPVMLAKALAETRADMAEMRKKPYFPMARFGEHFISVRNQFAPNSPVVWFSCYSTISERNAAVRQVQNTTLHSGLSLNGLDMTIGKVPENVQEFMGLPLTLLKSIKAKLPGITPQQGDWLEQFGSMMAPERSFRKRFLKRKGTPGHSYDAMRVYAHYFRSGANYLARITYKDQLEDDITATENTRKNMWDKDGKREMIVKYMRDHLKYVMTGGNDWARFKGIISVMQLGLSVASAVTNLTQTHITTHPHLAAIFGYGKSGRELVKIMKATKRTFGKPQPGVTSAFLRARDEMIDRGKIDIGQAPELGGYAEGPTLLRLSAGSKAQRYWRNFSHVSMWMFGQAERFNRELAFAAAYELALNDHHNAYVQNLMHRNIPEINELRVKLQISLEEATALLVGSDTLDRTQFNYAPYARPAFLQSGPASSMLVFFQFQQNMLNFLNNNPGKVQALIMMLVLGGLAGLPGSDDFDKLIKLLMRRGFNKNWSPLDAAREFMANMVDGTIFDEVAPDVLLHGTARYSFGAAFMPDGYGVPQFDASANVSMGNLVPGLAPAAEVWARGGKWDEMTAKVAMDVAGAGFGQVFAWMKFLDSGGPFTTDAKKWEMVNFRAGKAWSKAARYLWDGADVNPDTGEQFMKFNLQDPDDVMTIAAQAMGFTPRKINEKWEQIRIAKDLEAWLAFRQKGLLIQYDGADRSGDKDALKDADRAIDKYNDDVTGMGLPELEITNKTISKSLKMKEHVRELREGDEGLTKKQEAIKDKFRSQFPEYHYEGEVTTKIVK